MLYSPLLAYRVVGAPVATALDSPLCRPSKAPDVLLRHRPRITLYGVSLSMQSAASRPNSRASLAVQRSSAAVGQSLARQLAGGAGVRPCRRMTAAIFATSGGPPGFDASTSRISRR